MTIQELKELEASYDFMLLHNPPKEAVDLAMRSGKYVKIIRSSGEGRTMGGYTSLYAPGGKLIVRYV